jgi:hypothetical protein
MNEETYARMTQELGMRRFTLFIVVLGFSAAMSVSNAQASGTALCNGIVARIQMAPETDAWSMLTQGKQPYIEVAGESETNALGFDVAANNEELVNRFISKFNPSSELRKAWADILNYRGHIDVDSLSGSDLHVVTTTGGSAHCLSFMFFRTPQGRQSELLPDLPNKSDRDGDNLICSNYRSDGYLARVGGVEAFVETYSNEAKQYVRIVPLRDNRWANACAVNAEYRIKYETKKAFVPERSALTEGELKIAASQIAERREAVKEAKDFSFGPPLSERDKEEVRTMANLAAKSDGEPVPAFGHEAELAAGEETLRSGDSFPLELNGKAYLMRLGEGQLGCCYSTGPLLILYTLKDGKLEPAGSAVVQKSRGTLQSVGASSSR